jgi:hypothetical protein
VTTPRRTLWLFTTLTVAWTALWPLVSSAHALLASEPVELCHQAGMQVAPGEMPMKPGMPESGKQHCPLCVMAFYGAFEAPPAPPASSYFAVAPLCADACGALPSTLRRYTPPSRAPPA